LPFFSWETNFNCFPRRRIRESRVERSGKRSTPHGTESGPFAPNFAPGFAPGSAAFASALCFLFGREIFRVNDMYAREAQKVWAVESQNVH
jgi:hypothetical protein